MNRLRKKKAAGRIKLYHVTSAQTLLKIADDGQVMPSGYTGSAVNVYTNNEGNQTNGSDQGGVYLLSESSQLSEIFGDNVTFKSSDGVYPNFPVVLEVYVDTDALTPDYDDVNNFHADKAYDAYDTKNLKNVMDEKSQLETDEYWKKSLDIVGHVVHQGPISTSDIQKVIFQINFYNIYEGTKLSSLINDPSQGISEDFIPSFYEDEYGITQGNGLSFSDAVKSIEALFKEIDDLQTMQQNTQENTASIKNRLKKLS